MKRLGILLSVAAPTSSPSTDAITENRLNAEIAIVLSNIESAPGLAAARDLGLPTLAIPSAGRKRADHDAEMIAQLHHHNVDLVCLAGYMRIISPAFVAAFPNCILNVHPSLLPAFPGLDAQHQAFNYGAKIAGCTVHFVDEAVDHGVIILQNTVPVLDDRYRRNPLRPHPRAGAQSLPRSHRPRPKRQLHHPEPPLPPPYPL